MQNFRLYLKERFPVPVTFALSLAVAASAYAAAQSNAIRAGAPLQLGGAALGGVLLVFLFLFHLRVFDEHKDFELDNETRPDRPVQRGLISLSRLRVLGAIAIGAQVVLALTAGAAAGIFYAIPLAYSVLMYFEFFAKDWLASRLGLYALTHTLVMSLLALAVGLRWVLPTESAVPPALWGVLALNLTSFFSVDVLRKTWAPESEVEGLDSYSKRFGIAGAAAISAALLAVSAGIAGWIGWRLGGGLVWVATDVAVTLWCLYQLRVFVRSPTVKRQKGLEVVAGIHLLVLFLGLAVVAAITNGVHLGLR